MQQSFGAPKSFSEKAYINSRETYEKMYKESLENPDVFWGRIADEFTWSEKYKSVLSEEDFTEGRVSWFSGGKLNITVNCLDRHLKARGDKVAFVFEANTAGEVRKFTYREVYERVCQYGNFLRNFGVKKGDRVCFYGPMIPDAIFLMLACARIGAVHNIIFGGYSGNSIRERIEDCKASFVITANEGLRGEKTIPLKGMVDEALSEGCDCVTKVIVLRHTKNECDMRDGRDVWFDDVLSDNHKGDCPPEVMGAEDPLFILYTSGSTGKPKGVLHTVAGYMIYTATTLKYAFDIKEDDIFWCTADIGWITGHSYVVYGPLLNGSTSIVFEGVLTYPDAGRSWDMIERHKVTIFYTAPTLIRLLEKEGDEFPNAYDLSSLRLLGSVGEPINPEPWLWYYRVIGKERCPIIDTYWQTETGGFIIMPFPAAYPFKPGSAGRPFFGIEPKILDDNGNDITNNHESGRLVIKHSWPGMMRGVYGNSGAFREKYFLHFPGYYETGDGARMDEDSDFWLFGRIDDVLSVAGHRLGTAEIENALVSHALVSEAAVVGIPDEVKGESVCAYVVLKIGRQGSQGKQGSQGTLNQKPSVTIQGSQGNEGLEKELRDFVGEEVGAVAKPTIIRFVPGLPKTRSGKIMRRILKKIASGDKGDLGDLSALADPEIVEKLRNL